jgi:hypothetical protein
MKPEMRNLIGREDVTLTCLLSNFLQGCDFDPLQFATRFSVRTASLQRLCGLGSLVVSDEVLPSVCVTLDVKIFGLDAFRFHGVFPLRLRSADRVLYL